MPGKKFLNRLGKEWLFFDGGTGSLLQARGLLPGEPPELWNLTHPEEVIRLSENYFRAGADIVNANTFGVNGLRHPGQVKKLVKAAVAHAKEGRRRAGRKDAYVALDLGPTGKLLSPMGDLPFEDAVKLYGELAKAGANEGVDLINVETMSDTYEAKAAVLGIKEACDLPVGVSFTFDLNGKLLTGADVDAVVAIFEGLGVDFIGMNCGLGPKQMLPLIKRMVQRSSIPVVVNPNAGLPRTVSGQTVYDIMPRAFATHMRAIAKCGVQAVGGCCGTTPAHLEKEIEVVRAIPFVPIEEKEISVVASYAQAVDIDGTPRIIGERINPTGKKRFQEALRNEELPYILGQGLEEEKAGAEILDVNVGLPDIDEPKMMETVVRELQAVCALPLQIDAADAKALEAGLRTVNGKALINSVNGKASVLKQVLPLAKKYGGMLVVLPLDEKGIPKTAAGRIRVARRVIAAAKKAGIREKDIAIDGLTMAVSAEADGAKVTLETVRRVREELGVRTILGVSNVSFGLPARSAINASFLAMAIHAGLDLAIINPNSAEMLQAFFAARALLGKDAQFADYIQKSEELLKEKEAQIQLAGQTKAPGEKKTRIASGDPSSARSALADAVLHGLPEAAKREAQLALHTRKALSLVDGDLVPALDEVGKGFERGTLFLPQLLKSAEAAQAAFSVIKDALQGAETKKKGRIILATVKNDIHDIGKNIVKVMLENYGYEVLDLGRDVPAEKIVETALRENIHLVGLSALMTTTVASMEETIALLHKQRVDAKVLVGGAVLTPSYAAQIGADAYAKDAMAAVRYADTLFSGKENKPAKKRAGKKK